MKLLDHDGLRDKGIRYSKVQLWRLVRNGTFPAPIKIGAGRNVWLESEIDNLIEQRIAARDGANHAA